jgi:ligand-binding sensor domain-containing protein
MTRIAIKFIVLIMSFPVFVNAQHLFPKQFNNCKTDQFCLDCGDIKANVDEQKMNALVQNLTTSNNLKGIKGKVMFQILVDAAGKGCVLSHSDASGHPVSTNIANALNKFDGFIPAQTQGKNEAKTSFNMSFEIADEKLIAKVERVDMEAFGKSFDRPQSPEIYNKKYVYKNENLKNYTITTWNSKNSNLPNNLNDHIAIDRNGVIWVTIDDGLMTFDGTKFNRAEQNITEKGKYFSYYAIAVDNDNVKWTYGKDNIYSYNDKEWKIYQKNDIGMDGAYEIVNNPSSGEVFFCADEGLVIYQNGKWSRLDQASIKGLPSNRIFYAKRDSKNRLWIGTVEGSVMVDVNGAVTNFEKSRSVLRGKCITSMDEDEEGNLYFSLFEFNRKATKKVNNNEGIAIWYKDGTVKQFTTDNSGMPFNHTNCVLYDKKEKVLWISTDRAGLVRYDLKDGWENYHSENSAIPTSHISTMAFDNKGVLYLATRQGLVRVERK